MEKLFKITLRNDYAFKRVFGVEENRDILQDLLECILDIPSKDISGLELLDKEFHKELCIIGPKCTTKLYNKAKTIQIFQNVLQ